VPRSKNECSSTFTLPISLHGVVLSEAQEQLYLYLYKFWVFKNKELMIVCGSEIEEVTGG
jgi:hypothetical protein